MIEYLYKHHYRYLFMVAYNICQKWDMTEDIVQDGFIKILSSSEVFTDWQHARKYLCGCIRYAAFDRLSSDKRSAAAIRDFIEPTLSPVSTIGINLYKLRSAMSRAIIKEIYYHNRTRRSIAQEYKISRTAVRNTEVKALKELKLILTIK